MAGGDEFFDDGGADKASGSGDEDAHAWSSDEGRSRILLGGGGGRVKRVRRFGGSVPVYRVFGAFSIISNISFVSVGRYNKRGQTGV